MTREDIDVTSIEITDSIRFAGRTFKELNDLRKSVVRNDNDLQKAPPFVVLVQKGYPCFDSSDSMYEDRSYQAYFLTMDRVKAAHMLEESKLWDWDLSRSGREREFPVMEPMFSMSIIQEHHLPYIYYHGEGEMMEIVQDRNAEEQVEVISQVHRRRFFEDPDPIGCLYGPPPDLEEIYEWLPNEDENL